jgi:hypothetical protein
VLGQFGCPAAVAARDAVAVLAGCGDPYPEAVCVQPGGTGRGYPTGCFLARNLAANALRPPCQRECAEADSPWRVSQE